MIASTSTNRFDPLPPLPSTSTVRRQQLTPLPAFVPQREVRAPEPEPTLPPPPPKRPSFLERTESILRPIAEAAGSAREKAAAAAQTFVAFLVRDATLYAEDPRDWYRNRYAGIIKGSFLIPDALAPEPINPDPVGQKIGAVVGSVGEGALAELAALRALSLAASSSKVPAVAKVAEHALRLFGQGEDLSAARQIAGSAALGVGVEAGLNTVGVATGDISAEQALENMRLPAIVGGTVAGFAGASAAVRRQAPDIIERAREVLVRKFVPDPEMAKIVNPDGTTMRDVFRAHTAMRNNAANRAVDRVANVISPITSRFDVGPFRMRRSQVGMQLSYRLFKKAVTLHAELESALVRSASMADIQKASDRLSRFFDRMRRRLSPDHVNEIERALDRHNELVNEMLSLEQQMGTRRSFYADVYWRERTNLPEDVRDYSHHMARELHKIYKLNADVELMRYIADNHGSPMGSSVPNGYRFVHTGDMPVTMRTAARLSGLLSPAESKGQSAYSFLIPGKIAERLESMGLVRNLRAETLGYEDSLDVLANATNWWKGATLFWGGMALQSAQILSDAVALARSAPGVFINPSAWSRAARLLSRKYRVSTRWFDHVRSAIPGVAGGVYSELSEDDPELGDAVFKAALAGTIGSFLPVLSRKNRRGAWDLAAHNEYHRLADVGVIDSGFFGNEVGRLSAHSKNRLYADFAQEPVPFARQMWDSLRSLVSGRVTGNPFEWVASSVDGWMTLMRERENFLRLVHYYHQVQKGVPEELAVKRARDALIDYGLFTDFENRFLRGFLLPFYSFFKGNTVNWAKAITGNDPGGMKLGAVATTVGILGFEGVAQMWNEMFEEEQQLPPEVRRDFHIIVGMPTAMGGDGALRNDRGEPIVLGMKMPTEQVLELLGLEGVGVITSHLFGSGMPEDDSLIGRAQRIEDFDLADEATRALFRGTAQQVTALLNPGITLGIEALTGEHLAFGTPIVSPYSDEGARTQWLDHAARRLLPAYRAATEVFRDVYDENGVRWNGWDFYTSRIGAGLPLSAMDRDRALKYRLGDMMELAQRDADRLDKTERLITDLIYQRDDPNVPNPNELTTVYRIIAENAEDARHQSYLMQYYGQQSGRRSRLSLQWDSMSLEARARFLRMARPEDVAALVIYLNGGSVFSVDEGQ